jgi:peroxiredoxin
MPSNGTSIGDRAPRFRLSDTEGNDHAVGDAGNAAAAVVVFTCNHCPYALAWHDRIAQAARDFGPRGVRFLAVNPNDAERYPADSYAAMQRRVAEEDWPMPYLHDADQEVARAFGARTTPDVFVLDAEGRVVYRGAPDGDHGDPSLDAAWLREALDDTLAGARVRRPQTEPVGCSVKWKR